MASMGVLGSHEHFRCVNCGNQSSSLLPKEERRWPDFDKEEEEQEGGAA